MSPLADALLAAQDELPTAVPRDSQGLGYRYTSLDALIAATALASGRILVTRNTKHFIAMAITTFNPFA